MIVKKLTGTIGAEIQNIDLSKEFGSEVFTEIEKALLENLVIVFRNQDLSPE